MLGVFNLLPIHPLDGSGVMEGLLPEPLLSQYAKIRPYGFIILLLLFYLLGLGSWIYRIITYIAGFLNVGWFSLKQIW
jgi:Zn-dependent protease